MPSKPTSSFVSARKSVEYGSVISGVYVVVMLIWPPAAAIMRSAILSRSPMPTSSFHGAVCWSAVATRMISTRWSPTDSFSVWGRVSSMVTSTSVFVVSTPVRKFSVVLSLMPA